MTSEQDPQPREGHTQAAEQASGASAPQADAPASSPDSLPLAQRARALLGRVRPGAVLLAINTLAVLLVGVAVLRPGSPSPSSSRAAVLRRLGLDRGPQARTAPAPPAERLRTVVPKSASWATAEAAFAREDYQAALVLYERLLEVSAGRAAEARLRDLFWMRIAACLKRLGEVKEAREVLGRLSRSLSPVIRACAYRDLALLDAEDGQWMKARMKAYLALSAAGSLEQPSGLESDCDFIIARALTQKALSFYNVADAVDWTGPAAGRWADPFSGLGPEALRRLLKAGSEGLLAGALGPEVRPGSRRRLFSARSRSAPLEELLSRLADASGVDVRWVSAGRKVRRRAVTVELSGVSVQRLAEIASGSVGLCARFTGDQVLVYDPRDGDSVLQQKQLLTREAVSCWRRFFLRHPSDERIPLAHFALASVCDYAGRARSAGDSDGADAAVTALREYQLIAHRYGRSSVAPRALLRSAKLRTHLRDYTGARADLLDLLDLYPDADRADETYLYLGWTTREAGMSDEAIRHFSRLYHLNLSLASRATAALEAGRCYYAKGDYREAAKWLKRFLALLRETRRSGSGREKRAVPVLSPDPGYDPAEAPPEALLLLGRCEAALGNLDAALGAFRAGAALDPARDLRVELTLETARVYVERGVCVRAIGALDGIEVSGLAPRQAGRVLLATAETFRAMGLAEKAVSMLRRYIPSIRDERTGISLRLELARCLTDAGELRSARRLLGEVLPTMSPGQRAYQAACDLAELSLRLGRYAQAVAIVRELLLSPCPLRIRRRAWEVSGRAYMALGDYDKAALAYSGMLFQTPPGPTGRSPSPTTRPVGEPAGGAAKGNAP